MSEKFLGFGLSSGEIAIGDAWVVGEGEAIYHVGRLIEGGFSEKEAGDLAQVVFGIEPEEARDRFIGQLIKQNRGDGSTL